jgi:flagellar basal-body rod protein FlgG
MPISLNQLWSIAASGIHARQRQMEVISHNIANANTIGFKGSQAGFQAVIREQEITAKDAIVYSARNPGDKIQEGLGTSFTHSPHLFSQGSLEQSDSNLHLAIMGEGFFQLQTPSGKLVYTRAGDFQQDASGRIVNSAGLRLSPDLSLPSDVTDVYADTTGRIWGRQAGSDTPQVFARIQLALFSNPDGLENAGQNLFLPTPASGEAIVGNPGTAGLGTIVSGFLENSNVDLGSQLVDMMRAQHSYSLSLRSLYSADEMYRIINDLHQS